MKKQLIKTILQIFLGFTVFNITAVIALIKSGIYVIG